MYGMNDFGALEYAAGAAMGAIMIGAFVYSWLDARASKRVRQAFERRRAGIQ